MVPDSDISLQDTKEQVSLPKESTDNIDEDSDKSEDPSVQPEVEFYDSEADDLDEKFLQGKTSTKRSDGSLWTTDAILSCAMCMNVICYDCQRHDRYPNQYRAMFVNDVVLKLSERLWYPRSSTFDPSKSKHSLKVPSLGPDSVVSQDPAQFLDQDSFFAAHCQSCESQVGLYDHDEIYHLFGVIASPP